MIPEKLSCSWVEELTREVLDLSVLFYNMSNEKQVLLQDWLGHFSWSHEGINVYKEVNMSLTLNRQLEIDSSLFKQSEWNRRFKEDHPYNLEKGFSIIDLRKVMKYVWTWNELSYVMNIRSPLGLF